MILRRCRLASMATGIDSRVPRTGEPGLVNLGAAPDKETHGRGRNMMSTLMFHRPHEIIPLGRHFHCSCPDSTNISSFFFFIPQFKFCSLHFSTEDRKNVFFFHTPLSKFQVSQWVFSSGTACTYFSFIFSAGEHPLFQIPQQPDETPRRTESPFVRQKARRSERLLSLKIQ